MTPRDIRHRVEHTKNKHSRAVCKNGTIVIRLARNLTRAEEQEHIEYLLRQMTKQILEEKQKAVISPFNHILESGQSQSVTLASGKTYLFTLIPGERTCARRTQRGWIISVGPRTRRLALHKLLWKLLSEAEQPRIDELVRRINKETFRTRISKVRLKFAASQWGSCSPKGVIMINSSLLFTPPSVLKYVIVHELAHRKRGDHSPTYWSWVESAMPSYERAKKVLMDYCLPTL